MGMILSGERVLDELVLIGKSDSGKRFSGRGIPVAV